MKQFFAPPKEIFPWSWAKKTPCLNLGLARTQSQRGLMGAGRGDVATFPSIRI